MEEFFQRRPVPLLAIALISLYEGVRLLLTSESIHFLFSQVRDPASVSHSQFTIGSSLTICILQFATGVSLLMLKKSSKHFQILFLIQNIVVTIWMFWVGGQFKPPPSIILVGMLLSILVSTAILLYILGLEKRNVLT